MSPALRQRLRQAVPTAILAVTIYLPLLLTKPGRGVQNEALKKALTAEETRLLLGKGGAGLGAVLGLETYPGQ